VGDWLNGGNDEFGYSEMKWTDFRSHIKRELKEHDAAKTKATEKARKKWRDGIMGKKKSGDAGGSRKDKKSGEGEGTKKNKKKRQRAGEDDSDEDGDEDERPQKAAKKKGKVDSDNLDESSDDSDADSD
jgi:hypothetical protein